MGELKFVSVSLNNSEVLWFVLWSDWHELGSSLSELKLVSISLNNSEVLWSVLWSDRHEFGISLGSDEVNLVKSNWDIDKSKVGGSLSVFIEGRFWVNLNWESLGSSLGKTNSDWR